MIKLIPTDNQIKRAEDLYTFHNIKNSITQGESEIYGALGEILFTDYCKSKNWYIYPENNKDYDLVVNGLTIDVKTKRTTVRPKPHYNCSVACTSLHQQTEYYVFIRITEDLKTAWLLGMISKHDFFNRAVFNKKGEPDGKFLFKEDCYNLAISKLKEKEMNKLDRLYQLEQEFINLWQAFKSAKLDKKQVIDRVNIIKNDFEAILNCEHSKTDNNDLSIDSYVLPEIKKEYTAEEQEYFNYISANADDLNNKALEYINKLELKKTEKDFEYYKKLSNWVDRAKTKEDKFTRMFIYDFVS